MKIALIAVGSELLNGKRADLNAFQCAQILNEEGLKLTFFCILPDDANQFRNLFQQLLPQFDWFILSGGLGPTQDDFTKDMVAQALNLSICYSEAASKVVKEIKQRKPTMGAQEENNYNQVIDGFEAVTNPVGMAPGLLGFLTHLGPTPKAVSLLPGVPSEFSAMLKDVIFQKVKTNLKDYFECFQGINLNYTLVAKTFEIPEYQLFFEKDPTLWDNLSKIGTVSSLPALGGVDVGIEFTASSNRDFLEKQAAFHHTIKASPIYPWVWSFSKDSACRQVFNRFLELGIKLSLVESCTGGLLSHQLTSFAGSSQIFLGTQIPYHADLKRYWRLALSETIDKFGLYSEEVTSAMAKGSLNQTGADYALATNGEVATNSPYLFVSCAYHDKNKNQIFVNTKRYVFKQNSRERLLKRFTEISYIHLLREINQNHPSK